MRDEEKFWIAVGTFPLWILPAVVIGFFWLVGWLVWTTSGLILSGAFAVIGKDEWSDRISNATGWEDDGSW